MKEISVIIKESEAATLYLGRRGEHGVRCIVLDCTELEQLYGAGMAVLRHFRNGDEDYHDVPITQNGALVRWVITAADTEKAVPGTAVLHWHVGNGLAKSNRMATETELSDTDDAE